MSDFDKLMEEIRKIKFSSFSKEQLDKLDELFEQKHVELKFVKRAIRHHR